MKTNTKDEVQKHCEEIKEMVKKIIGLKDDKSLIRMSIDIIISELLKNDESDNIEDVKITMACSVYGVPYCFIIGDEAGDVSEKQFEDASQHIDLNKKMN
ncbi:MAG: hypothetical protein ACRCZ0_05685 [Cetobacterium sp.]